MGYYAEYSGKSLPTFRTNLSIPSSRAKIRPIGKTVVNHHYMPRNSPEKRTSHLLRGGSLKSCAVFTAVLQKLLINKIINFGIPELFFTSAWGRFMLLLHDERITVMLRLMFTIDVRKETIMKHFSKNKTKIVIKHKSLRVICGFIRYIIPKPPPPPRT
jgi:hypothetical protein